MNFPSENWLQARAAASPEQPAIVHQGQVWSYAELADQTRHWAGWLSAEGARPGMRVGVWARNHPRYALLVHALAWLGATLVPFNTRLTKKEILAQAQQIGCGLILSENDELTSTLAAAGMRVLPLRADIEPAPVSTANPVSNDPAATQGLIFTSGTTGRSRAVILTFGAHFWSALASSYRLGVLPTDRWFLTLPLYHVGGMAILFRSALYGTSVVFPDDSENAFDASALADALMRSQSTVVSLVPTMLHRLLDFDPDASWARSLRLILLGGAAANPELLRRAFDADLPVAVTYGLTEAASQVATATPEQTRRKPGCAGKPLLFTKVRVITESGADCPPGEIGEALVSGMTVMPGYRADAESTQRALRDGWLHTGDLGYLDDDGDLWIVQRRADLIVSGGENVYPFEVEAALKEHPSVADACVVGLPDPEWGQRVAAAVLLRSDNPSITEADLTSHCETHLAGYKMPRVIHILSEFPLSASGKIQRHLVRELLLEKIGL